MTMPNETSWLPSAGKTGNRSRRYPGAFPGCTYKLLSSPFRKDNYDYFVFGKVDIARIHDSSNQTRQYIYILGEVFIVLLNMEICIKFQAKLRYPSRVHFPTDIFHHLSIYRKQTHIPKVYTAEDKRLKAALCNLRLIKEKTGSPPSGMAPVIPLLS